MSFLKVCDLKDFAGKVQLGRHIAARNVLLIRDGSEVHAYEDRCAHRGVKLSFGSVRDGRIQCPAHLWEYDVTTGRCVTQTAAALIKFAVRLDGDAVLVDLPDPTA